MSQVEDAVVLNVRPVVIEGSQSGGGAVTGAVLGGAHLVYHAAGWLEGGLTASFEKAVIDAEMLQMLAAWMQPVDTRCSSSASTNRP